MPTNWQDLLIKGLFLVLIVFAIIYIWPVVIGGPLLK